MGFEFDKWDANRRATFKDAAGNQLIVSESAVNEVIKEGGRKKKVVGKDFEDFMQPTYTAAKIAAQHLKI